MDPASRYYYKQFWHKTRFKHTRKQALILILRFWFTQKPNVWITFYMEMFMQELRCVEKRKIQIRNIVLRYQKINVQLVYLMHKKYKKSSHKNNKKSMSYESE